MTTGLAVLLFSRVFGMGALWHQVLGEGYARLVKTTVEEGIELPAYSLWLAASLEHFWRIRAVVRAGHALPDHVRLSGITASRAW